MHKTIVVVITIVALAAVAAVYVWSAHNRYYLVITNGETFGPRRDPDRIYEIDKKTGETWYVGSKSKTLITDSQSARPLEDIPTSEIIRLTGRAGYNNGNLFTGNVYNPTAWMIREIHIRVYGPTWDRVFADNVSIPPLASGQFQFDTVERPGAPAPGIDGSEAPVNWNIVSARGYRNGP